MVYKAIFLALAIVAILSGSRADVLPERTELTEDQLLGQPNPECTSIYTVTFSHTLSTQGNDLGMLPTHGKDTRISPTDSRYANFAEFGSNVVIGQDYRGEPFKNDAAKQAAARARFSVTALTEMSGRPMGFYRSTYRIHRAVCVKVQGSRGRWMEIMAETIQPDQQICVGDWGRTDLADNPNQEACGNGKLYMCRDSPVLQGTSAQNDVTGFKFFCRDSCDDPDFEFYWRIVLSQQTAVEGAQPDGENWCSMRDGDDYPSSLLDPYPDEFQPPPVFARLRSSAAGATVTVTTALALAAIAALRCLL